MAVMLHKMATYNPLNDPVYMSPRMKQYFQERLYKELQKLLDEERSHFLSFSESVNRETDFVDQSAVEALRFNHNAYHEHEQHLRHDVEAALQRLEGGSYGYCVATGKPIGIERLIAAPYAMYCFGIQAEKEGHQQSRWG